MPEFTIYHLLSLGKATERYRIGTEILNRIRTSQNSSCLFKIKNVKRMILMSYLFINIFGDV